MNYDIDALPKKLQPHYSAFKVAERLLFTGHSHQAWPDVVEESFSEYWSLVSENIDQKWDACFEKVGVLQDYLERFYQDSTGLYSYGANTHGLLTAWISALPLKSKPQLITTEAEFHSVFRQVSRLKEEGLDIVFVPTYPLEGFADRLISSISEKTSGVIISRVYYNSGLINGELLPVSEYCNKRHIPLLIDDYHGTNVVPLAIVDTPFHLNYFLIGGYKYLQWGEGNCFLRFPASTSLRPAITGWFSSFDSLQQPRSTLVSYSNGPNRFMGGTIEPFSAFRAAKVVSFFDEQNLSPEVLAEQYQHQVAYALAAFRNLDLPKEWIRVVGDEDATQRGGFLALNSPIAGQLHESLRNRGVFTDYRDRILRFGMAPYVLSEQIDLAMEILREEILKLDRH